MTNSGPQREQSLRLINKQQTRNISRINTFLTNPENYPSVLQALEICDGHTIFDLTDFSMLPEYVRDHFAKLCPSDPPAQNPKGTIFADEGPVVTGLFGIYGLDIIEAAARAHKLTSPKNGRGFRATDLKEKLRPLLSQPAG